MLFSRSDLPGIQGATRDLTGPKGITKRKLHEGDIAVINQADINRADAQKLVDANVAAVVNLSPFTTGQVPNFGPQLMLNRDITLVESNEDTFDTKLKNGKKGRLDDGKLYYGEKLITAGAELSSATATERFEDAREALGDHMVALSGNLAEFTRSEAPLLVDGLGIPDVGVDMDDRKVLIVSEDADIKDKLKDLRYFLREYEPVIIGVGAAADTLMEAGHRPEIIVGDPEALATDTLRGGATVVVPADPDGHAPGLERIQDLGVAAMTFPAASSNATDLAMLLAHYHGASMIVHLGETIDLDNVFAHSQEEETPSAIMTRLRIADKLVDSTTVAEFYRVSSSGGGWLWAIIGIILAIAVIVAIAGLSGDSGFVDNLVNSWNSLALNVQEWFK